MKIKIEDFGRHERLALDDRSEGDVMFVVGNNRVGKSTIRDAIEFALLGSCQIRGFKHKKDVATYMIREGASSARVTLQVGPWVVRRSVSRGGASKIEVQINPTEGFVEMNATQWHAHFNVDADAVRVALDAEQFYRMDEKARRKLLIAVKDSEGLDEKDVWEALGSALTSYAKESTATDGKLRGICTTAATLGFAPADAQAVEYRRDAKRDLQEIHNALEALPPIIDQIDGIDITVGETAAHEAKLRAVTEEARTLRHDRDSAAGETTGRMLEAVEQKARAQAALAERSGRSVSVELDGETTRYTEKQLRELRDGALASRDIACDAKDKAGERLADLEQIYDKWEAQDAALAVLVASPAVCPAAGFDMKCPVRPTTFRTAYEKQGGDLSDGVEEHLQAAEIARDEQRHEVAALGDAWGRCDALLDLWANALTEARLQQRATSSAQEALEEIQSRIDVMTQEAEALGEGPTEDDVAAGEARVATGTRIVEARRTLDARRTLEDMLKENAEDAKVLVLWWDEVEKLLRPDGIESALASMATSKFAESLESCDALAKVRITDAMDLTINEARIETRSKSEQLCGGIALQAAMSLQIGLPILVIDEVDKLDASWKRTFQGWAAEQSKAWRTGVLALATSDADPPGTPPEGFTTAWVREGEKTLLLGGGFD